MLQYYANHKIPRKYTIQIIKDFKMFLETNLECSNTIDNSNNLQIFTNFDIPDTENKFKKYLKELDVYFDSQTFIIHKTFE